MLHDEGIKKPTEKLAKIKKNIAHMWKNERKKNNNHKQQQQHTTNTRATNVEKF